MHPLNTLVSPLLTDLYQFTMCYGYWKNRIHEAESVFDLFFRKNPFQGEFTVFAGLEEVLRFVQSFRITNEDIDYLKDGIYQNISYCQEEFAKLIKAGVIEKNENGYKILDSNGDLQTISYPLEPRITKAPLSDCDASFFDWLKTLDCSKVRIYAVPEGSFVFPRVPLLRIEGPLAICQLLETTLLNLINYPSLAATNAARFRLAAGWDKVLLEFGLRRSQGPDGGVSASQYCYLGGFDATSNVLAGKLFGIPVRGTHAHSFISAFMGFQDLATQTFEAKDGSLCNFVEMVEKIRQEIGFIHTHTGELAAFVAYAQSFPNAFLGLVDTYDTLKSGVPNYLCVAIALLKLGYKPLGIRLDSGDLAYLSKESRKIFQEVLTKFGFEQYKLNIVASNDINEETLHSLKEQGHEIDTFGIGTHLVTCQKQPALGGVYKLVEINHHQRIKLSQEKSKMTIPGKKEAYRLIGKEGYPLIDLMMSADEPSPQPGQRVLCRHPFEASKRAYIIPSKVCKLHHLVWDGHRKYPIIPLEESRKFVIEQLKSFREDHLRSLNPTPYKIAVSDNLYNFLHNLWLEETPIDEII